MKLIATFDYFDDTDDYHPYSDFTVVPFEAASLEEGINMVSARVAKNRNDFVQFNSLDKNYDIFGLNFGLIGENQGLSFEVFTLEDWFEKNKKDINFNPHKP